jgi:hypothetical protein
MNTFKIHNPQNPITKRNILKFISEVEKELKKFEVKEPYWIQVPKWMSDILESQKENNLFRSNMPYSIKHEGSKFQIMNRQTGKVVGTSDTMAKAKSSVRARLASEHGWEGTKKRNK